jgi:hypothetical protein
MDSIGPASELARVRAVLQRYNIPLPDPEPTLRYCVAGEFHRHWGDTVTEAELNELLAIYKYPAPDLR